MTPDRADLAPSSAASLVDAAPPAIDRSIHDEIVRRSIDAIILIDRTSRIRVWSPSAEVLYGIPSTTAIGQPLAELIVAFDSAGGPIDNQAERHELETSGVWRQRQTHRPRTGRLAGRDLVVDANVTVLRDADGDETGTLHVNRDVTATARLEAEMSALGSLLLATGRARTNVEVAETALDILCRATGAEAGLVTSTESVHEATASRGVSQATVDGILAHGQIGGSLALALESPDAVVSADVTTAPLREDVRAAVLADGIRRLMVVGLRVGGRLTGVLALGWRIDAPQEPSKSITLQAAALVASSLENARLLAAVESGLSEERLLTRRMRALVELTRLPEAASGGGAAMERLIAEVSAIIGADGSVFAQIDGDRLVNPILDRIDPAWAAPLLGRQIANVPIAARLAAGTAAFLLPVVSGNLSTAGFAALAEHGYRALAVFAIRDGGRLSGLHFALFRRPIDELEIDERTLEAIGRVLDISFANRRLREVVSASERRYRELFELSPDALLVQSMDGVIVDANPAAVRLYGDGLIGRPVRDIVVTEPGHDEIGASDPSGVTHSTLIGRRLDGSTFPEEVDLRAIEMDGEQRVIAIVRDLTERRRMQAELVQAQKMEAIGLLVAGVAHELNNPLAAIVAFSQLIRTDPNLPPDLRTQADLLVQESNRTRVIVQNLLDFARQRPPERVETDLRGLVDGVLGLQSYIFGRNRMTVEVDIPSDLPRLPIDRSQIQQVLINLTVNAAQAIQEAGRPGRIRIQAAAQDGGRLVRIEISDDGPGIPASIADELFMPFVTTKQPGEGTGLGLSVSFGIVSAHGGSLRHEANAAGGATFIVELPTGREPAASAAPVTTAIPAQAASKMPGRPPGDRVPTADPRRVPVDDGGHPLRVLVLDDESTIRDFLGRALTRAGYEPILAATGPAAIDIIRADPPDAILCDHRMAGMNGTEFHAAVSELNPALGHRFAFMSGDVLNPELREFAKARGVHLLAKPFDIATVGETVANLLAVDAR